MVRDLPPVELEMQVLGHAVGRRWPDPVRALAALDAFPDRVVSLYLDVCWDDEQQPERARLSIKDQLRRLRAAAGRHEAVEALARDLDRVEAYVEERIRTEGAPQARGEAAFFCAARGLERGLRSTFRLPNLVLLGPTPALRPLLAALPTSGRVLCALADNAVTRLYELDSDDRGVIGMIEDSVPRRQRMGGWAQHKLQHWRLEEVAHHHKHAAEWLARHLDGEERMRVLVGGRPEVVSGFLQELPQPVMRRVRTVSGVASTDREAEALAGFEQALHRIEREEAEARLAGALDAARAGGRGAAGLDAVVAAANQGRVAELLFDDGFCRNGWRCARCGVIGVGTTEACSACGGPAESMELGEALAHAAVLHDAGVTVVAGPSRLALHEGVAAQLRF